MTTSPTPDGTIDVFYVYSRKDKRLLDKLITHLSSLKRLGVIRDWHDLEITAGTDWRKQLDHHLNTAGVILLLVSSDFLASDYCYDIEMKRAVERHDKGEARVIPVLLRPVDAWHEAPFGKLQALPSGGKPVTTWGNKDEAFADVARGIREAVQALGARSPGLSAHEAQPADIPNTISGQPPTPFSRPGLLAALSRLDPSDFALLVASLEDAALHVTRDAPVPKKAAELVEWAVSQGGAGLNVVHQTARDLVPNFR